MKNKQSKSICDYISLRFPEPFLDMIKKHIENKPEYNNISEFIREAIREKIRNEIIYEPDEDNEESDYSNKEINDEYKLNNCLIEKAKWEISMFN